MILLYFTKLIPYRNRNVPRTEFRTVNKINFAWQPLRTVNRINSVPWTEFRELLPYR